MKTHTNKTPENKNRSVANQPAQRKSEGKPSIRLSDNRPETVMQGKLQAMANNSASAKQTAQLSAILNAQNVQPPLQKNENKTGLPDNLKSGIENLSGYGMDDVKVHYNSSQPAQLNALAYAQGTDIHIAPGQEKHLPHEAWHVVQQKQGRVRPTMQMKGVAVNDDKGLEKEADVMGGKARQSKVNQNPNNHLGKLSNPSPIAQLTTWKDVDGILTFEDKKNEINWHWENNTMWYETDNPSYTNKSGRENSQKFEDWFRQSNYDIGLISSYIELNPQELPKGFNGHENQLLVYLLKNTSINYKELEKREPFSRLPKYKTQRLIGEITGEVSPQEKERQDKMIGENYLSADYRRINPLLAAFEKVGYPPEEYKAANFDFSEKKVDVLSQWKSIAVERKYADEELVQTWDDESLSEAHSLFKRITGVWDKFEKPNIPNNLVYRGDSEHLFTFLPIIDPKRNNYADGEHSLNDIISWPSIMSTTIGIPTQHNFISSKSVIWEIKVPFDHNGKIIGANNPSEQEVTFPVATKLSIKKILVRSVNKNLESSTYGKVATVIIKAEAHPKE